MADTVNRAMAVSFTPSGQLRLQHWEICTDLLTVSGSDGLWIERESSDGHWHVFGQYGSAGRRWLVKHKLCAATNLTEPPFGFRTRSELLRVLAACHAFDPMPAAQDPAPLRRTRAGEWATRGGVLRIHRMRCGRWRMTDGGTDTTIYFATVREAQHHVAERLRRSGGKEIL